MKKLYVILIALILITTTIFVDKKIDNNENTAMENFAKVIADETDADFENAAIHIINCIKNDSVINNWFLNTGFPSDDSILIYLDNRYFDIPEMYDYSRVLILCGNDTYLTIEETNGEILCNDMFVNILHSNNSNLVEENLFHIDDPTTDIYYLAAIDFSESQTMFIEFYKERTFNELENNLQNYSFGIYKNNILNYKFGNFLYPNSLKNFISTENGIHKGKKFKHFIINDLGQDKTIVVTIESEQWMRYLTPLSFIFFALLLAYYFYLYFKNDHRSGLLKQSFHSKMQLTILLTLTLSFVIVGFTSFFFIKNNVENHKQISQYKQANIIRNNLETNILKENSLTNKQRLFALKENFLCDINIYSIDGNLINTTLSFLPENINVQIIDNKAFNSIYEEGAGYFVHTEFYDSEKCTSYYFPILDKNNEIAAILNVPYFDSNSEYNDRISNFVLTYINIIIILLSISSIVVLLVTRNTLKPLKIIQEQMSKMSLGVKNEPIKWHSSDEIGTLIEQYNKMCWQLENSANKLARNERENAWREMARQVAHEIKNPLTPMRLNIEYLQMLWDRKDANFEKNFKETLESLLEQIETLSRIVTAYSNYAKLPGNSPTPFDLSELVKSTVKLYDVDEKITVSLTYDENEDWSLFADKNNLGRVVGNILKNATQAVSNTQNAHIEVSINKFDNRYKINIADNGCGIKEKDKAKIFFPNFTTKSSGMGVGLSVSQDIMQSIGGNISFTSTEGSGTVFTIDIPMLKE